MKKSIFLATIISLFFMMNSCTNETTLQQYLVESQDKKGFVFFDVPSSLLQFKNQEVSDDIKATLKSIRKINLVALPIKGNETAYEIEKETLRAIFKNDTYKSLMSMKVNGMNLRVFYTGSTNAINEVIVFGFGKNSGVGVARLLGEQMNPGKMIAMLNKLSMNPEDLNLNQFKQFFDAK